MVIIIIFNFFRYKRKILELLDDDDERGHSAKMAKYDEEEMNETSWITKSNIFLACFFAFVFLIWINTQKYSQWYI